MFCILKISRVSYSFSVLCSNVSVLKKQLAWNFHPSLFPHTVQSTNQSFLCHPCIFSAFLTRGIRWPLCSLRENKDESLVFLFALWLKKLSSSMVSANFTGTFPSTMYFIKTGSEILIRLSLPFRVFKNIMCFNLHLVIYSLPVEDIWHNWSMSFP